MLICDEAHIRVRPRPAMTGLKSMNITLDGASICFDNACH
jgi:hypothetical protein